MVFPCLLFQAGSYGQLPGICTVCLHLQWASRGETIALKRPRWKILGFAEVHTTHVFIPGSCWSGDQQWWTASCESHHPFGRTSAHGNYEKMLNHTFFPLWFLMLKKKNAWLNYFHKIFNILPDSTKLQGLHLFLSSWPNNVVKIETWWPEVKTKDFFFFNQNLYVMWIYVGFPVILVSAVCNQRFTFPHVVM